MFNLYSTVVFSFYFVFHFIALHALFWILQDSEGFCRILLEFAGFEQIVMICLILMILMMFTVFVSDFAEFHSILPNSAAYCCI